MTSIHDPAGAFGVDLSLERGQLDRELLGPCPLGLEGGYDVPCGLLRLFRSGALCRRRLGGFPRVVLSRAQHTIEMCRQHSESMRVTCGDEGCCVRRCATDIKARHCPQVRRNLLYEPLERPTISQYTQQRERSHRVLLQA